MEKKALALILLFLLVLPALPVKAGWLTGWKYRRAITISNTQNANTLTNYQVLITLDTQSLILAGKMRSDAGDIRFTDSDGATLLSYWIESGINTTSTNIWVKVPSIPASSTKVIYVYYGNPSATSASNGDATFDFFDGFDGTSLDTNKWSTEWLYGASYTVSNGVITITSAGTRSYIHSVPTFSAPFAIRAKVQKINNDIELSWFVTGPFFGSASNPPTTAYSVADAVWATPEKFQINKASNKTWFTLTGTTLSISTGWHVVDVYQKTTGIDALIDGSNKISTGDTSFQSGNIALSNRETSGAQQAFDWILVRKYTSPEPTASVGPEELNLPPSVSITSVSQSSIYRGSAVIITGSYGTKYGYVTAVYVNISSPSGLVITNGLATLSNPNGNGTWSYSFGSTASSALGSYSIAVKAVNTASNFSTASLSNAFSVLNNPPVISAYGYLPSLVQVNSTVLLWLKASDFETQTLSARAVVTDPSNSQTQLSMTYNSTTARYEAKYTPAKTGSYSVLFTATDADSASATASLSFTATACPAIGNAVARPANSSRPANITVNVYVSDPDTPDSQLIVKAKIGSTVKTMQPNGTAHWFTAWFYFDTTAAIGCYDVYVNATDGTWLAEKTFRNLFYIYNLKPAVLSVSANNATRWDSVLIKVAATDPDTPPGGLSVSVVITDPNNAKITLPATWDGSYYTATFLTGLSNPVGEYFVSATAKDPEGVEGGPAIGYFWLFYRLPKVLDIKASTASPYVNSTVYLAAEVESKEVDPSLLSCDFYIMKNGVTIAKVKGQWNGIEFIATYNPVQAGSYDVNAMVVDPNGYKANLLKQNVFAAVSLPAQSTVKLPTQSEFAMANLSLPNWLSFKFQDLLVLLESNALMVMALILIAAVVVMMGGGGRRSGSRKRRR